MADYKDDKLAYWRACDAWTLRETLFILVGETPPLDPDFTDASRAPRHMPMPNEIQEQIDCGLIEGLISEPTRINTLPPDRTMRGVLQDAIAVGELPATHRPSTFKGSHGYNRELEPLLKPNDVIVWAASRGCFPDFLFATEKSVGITSLASHTATQAESDSWKLKARNRAIEIIEHYRKKDLYPSQESIAVQIAKEWNSEKVMGSQGKPLTGSYIKRHALKGISSAQVELISTSKGKSK